jgi:PAS domain S-box-containing protein
MLYVSPAYEEIWGRSVASLLASPRDWIDAIHADDRERVLQALPRQARGEYAEEYRIVRPDGEVRWIRDRAFPVLGEGREVHRIVGIAEDITDRKHSELQLRASEANYRALVECAPDGIFIADATGRYVDVNGEGARLVGYTREEVLLKGIADIVATREIARIPQEIGRLKAGASVCSEWEFLRADGTSFTGEVSATFLPDGRVLGILRDMTERKAAEDTVRKLHEDLRRHAAELEVRVDERTHELRMANMELEAFTSAASHDLRAPLNRILGFSAMLLDDGALKNDSRHSDLLRRIGHAGNQMEQIVRDLLELSKAASGELRRKQVDISGLVMESLGKLREVQPARTVVASVESGMTARGDPGLLRIAFDNLLGNAWKFSAKRGEARIEVGWDVKREGPPEFFVRDNGAGFDMSGASKLFEPFQRLHAKGEFDGTGIGLATVRRIVERHGGRIRAEAKVDHGATFRFTLAPSVAGP